jgi:hypothetical protein
MQDIAPAYLKRFMSHVEALLWLAGAQVRNAAQPIPGMMAKRKGGIPGQLSPSTARSRRSR